MGGARQFDFAGLSVVFCTIDCFSFWQSDGFHSFGHNRCWQVIPETLVPRSLPLPALKLGPIIVGSVLNLDPAFLKDMCFCTALLAYFMLDAEVFVSLLIDVICCMLQLFVSKGPAGVRHHQLHRAKGCGTSPVQAAHRKADHGLV